MPEAHLFFFSEPRPDGLEIRPRSLFRSFDVAEGLIYPHGIYFRHESNRIRDRHGNEGHSELRQKLRGLIRGTDKQYLVWTRHLITPVEETASLGPKKSPTIVCLYRYQKKPLDRFPCVLCVHLYLYQFKNYRLLNWIKFGWPLSPTSSAMDIPQMWLAHKPGFSAYKGRREATPLYTIHNAKEPLGINLWWHLLSPK